MLGLVGVLGVLMLSIAAIGGWRWLEARVHGPGPSAEAVEIVVPRGAGLASIALDLADAGVIRSPDELTLYAKFRGAAGSLQAGEYRFPAAASLAAVTDQMIRGDVLQRRVTIAEGLTSAQAVQVIAEAEAMSGEITAIPPEGALLPETYLYTRGDERAALVAQMTAAMDDALAELWAARADDLPFDTPEDALILASIVEKETGIDGERGRVAAVFVNRLRRGMRLQSDPTVIYGVTGGETFDLGRRIRRSELDADNPYNTYKIAGLPPTPIANPGREAIAATLNPPTTDELYFVADGSGGHAFARTLREHQANVRKWRAIQRERGLR
ncbi:MAG: endolytic transglycosylase MltG [Pseudomonadota bacterium]